MKVYAYVKYESFYSCGAVFPGSFVGNTPVSRHCEYTPWLVGKRETLAIIARGRSFVWPNQYYRYQCASLVAKLLGWSQKGTK